MSILEPHLAAANVSARSRRDDGAAAARLDGAALFGGGGVDSRRLAWLHRTRQRHHRRAGQELAAVHVDAEGAGANFEFSPTMKRSNRFGSSSTSFSGLAQVNGRRSGDGPGDHARADGDVSDRRPPVTRPAAPIFDARHLGGPDRRRRSSGSTRSSPRSSSASSRSRSRATAIRATPAPTCRCRGADRRARCRPKSIRARCSSGCSATATARIRPRA